MFHTDSVYILIFGSGFLGGFGHCIGMCGPIVASYCLNLIKKGNYLPHIFYHLGRITTYSIIGGMMGLVGSFVNVFKAIERFQKLTMALVGLLMIVMGLSIARLLPFAKRLEGVSIHRFIIKTMKVLSEGKTIGVYYPMGIVLGFLPCGLLYTAFIAAAGVGASSETQIEGFLKGMTMLFLFGLGTTPSLFLLGYVVTIKGEWIRNKLYKASAILIIVTGLIFTYRALSW